MIRHPVPVDLNKGLRSLDEVLNRNFRHAQTVCRVLHTTGIAVRTEQLDFTLGGLISLHAFKDFLGIVENDTGRVQFEVVIGLNAGVVPADSFVIVHEEHMIRENLTESEFADICRFCLRIRGLGDFDIHTGSPLNFM